VKNESRTLSDVDRHERIQAARKHAKLARRVFGARFDPPVTYETIRQWETNKGEPRPDKYEQMEALTGVRASWIFSGTGPMLVGDETLTVDDVMELVRAMPEADRWQLVGEISLLRSGPPDIPPRDR
jgi:ribosome-binding protein aMBF1 (putative translation factor)